jgi:uncharacterized protein with HEPN domain
MSLPLANILKHIRDEVAYLQRSAKGLSKADFLADETLKRAFVRSLEIIGEAVKQIPEEQRAEHDEIPWRAISAMRDVLIHHYFGVDYDIVWDVVQTQLAPLGNAVDELLKTIE